MIVFKKKVYMGLAFTLLLIFSLAQIPKAYSAGLSSPEKALSAITDVLGLDITEYNVELATYSSNRQDVYGGLNKEEVKYNLETTDSKIQVIFTFIDKKLARFDLYPRNGSTLPSLSAQKLPANILDAAKVFIQRLQDYSGASYLQDMHSMMDTTAKIESMNKTAGKLKCVVQVNGKYTALTWIYTSNGVDYPKFVGVYFENGALMGFSDRWSLSKIGSEIITISREEAIRLAQEQAKNATNVKIVTGDNSYEEVKLNLDGRINAKLSGAAKEPLTLYPFWLVELHTDKPYNGITKIQVGIWADTGEIEYCHPTGFYGNVEENSSTKPTEAPTSPENTMSPASIHIAVIIATTTIAIASIAVFIKRRSI